MYILHVYRVQVYKLFTEDVKVGNLWSAVLININRHSSITFFPINIAGSL